MVLPLAAFALLWLDLIRQLSYVWRANEQYAYGWFVPLLALGLFVKKWPLRPQGESRKQKAESRNGTPGLQTRDQGPRTVDQGPVVSGPVVPSSCSPVVQPSVSGQWSVVGGPPPEVSSPWSVVRGLLGSRFLLSAFCFLLLFLFLPLRVIHEINQDWPLISWALAGSVVILTLYALHLAGPPSLALGPWSSVRGQWSVVRSPWSLVPGPWSLVSPWVRHFAFPICFILVAVQWPYRIENPLTKGLMRLDTNITVEILGWLNIPAVQHGNLIELATGTVGVDEACSGIRSFQSTLMAALFLGELYLLRWRPRLVLVLGGLALAFAFNVVRTFILSWQANTSGMSAIDKWHDPAGFTITIACFLCLWAVAVLITKRTKSHTLAAPKSDEGGSAFIPHPPSRFPLSAFYFLLFLVLWVPFVLLANEAWYRSRPVDQSKLARWWVSFPTNTPAYGEVPVSKAAQKLLKYDQGTTAAWTESDDSDWSVFCFRWRAGDPTARMSALGHRPEYCMTGSGHQMNAELGTKYLPANGLKLPFRTYIFDAPARPLYVFFCLWEDGAEQQRGFAKTKYHDRLRSVLDRRRGLGQQTLEIICSGYQGIEQAQAAVTARLPGLIKIETPRSVARSP